MAFQEQWESWWEKAPAAGMLLVAGFFWMMHDSQIRSNWNPTFVDFAVRCLALSLLSVFAALIDNAKDRVKAACIMYGGIAAALFVSSLSVAA